MENVLNMKQSQKQVLLQQMMKEVCNLFVCGLVHAVDLLPLWTKLKVCWVLFL